MPEQLPTQAQGGQEQDNGTENPENNSGTPSQDKDPNQGGDNQDQAQGGQDQGTEQDTDQNQGTDNQDADDKDADTQNQDTDDKDGQDGGEDSEDGDDDLTDAETDALDAKVKRTLSKVRRENSNLRDRLKGETTRADRAEIALELPGISKDALKFITGSTREEMEQSAEELLVLMGYTGGVTPPGVPVERGGNSQSGNNGVPVSQASEETDLDKIGSRMYRK